MIARAPALVILSAMLAVAGSARGAALVTKGWPLDDTARTAAPVAPPPAPFEVVVPVEEAASATGPRDGASPRYEALAEIYAALPAPRAAALVRGLPVADAALLLAAMPQSSAGALLAELDDETAIALTLALARTEG